MLPLLQYKKRYERSFHKSAITSVAFNSFGSLLAASSLDGRVSVWEVDTGLVLHCINARTPVHSLVWSSKPEGFIFGCENGTLVSVFIEQVFIGFSSPLPHWQLTSRITHLRHRLGAHTFMHTPDLFAAYLLTSIPPC